MELRLGTEPSDCPFESSRYGFDRCGIALDRARAATARAGPAAAVPAIGRMGQAAEDDPGAPVRGAATGHRDPAPARSRRWNDLLSLPADLGAAFADHRDG